MVQLFLANKFAAAIKKKREKEKLNIRAAAGKFGVGIGTLSRIENGDIIQDINKILLICDWLEVSVCDFISTQKIKKKK